MTNLKSKFASSLGGLIITSLLIASCASSKPPKGKRGPDRMQQSASYGGYIAKPVGLLFSGFDQNNDAILTKDELENAIPLEWTRADTDRDNTLTIFELRAWSAIALGSEHATPGRISFDSNGNSRIEIHEFVQQLSKEFNHLDKDKDDQLTRTEMLRQLKMPTSKGQGQQKRGGGNGERGRGEGRRRG